MPRPSLTAEEIRFIMRLAGMMIPGIQPWPHPSRTDLDRFIREHCHRDADIDALRAVASEFDRYSDKANFLEHFQKRCPREFRVLVDFVYLGYYTRPEVIHVIQDECDCDYVSPPQPRGYVMPMELDINPTRRGSYTRTADVKRVDMSKLEHLEYFEID